MNLQSERITKEHILNAIQEIDKDGIEKGAQSSTYDLVYERKRYPPKYVLSLAFKYATGTALDRSTFAGGANTDAFNLLRDLGFEIMKKSHLNKGLYELRDTFLEQWPISKLENLELEEYTNLDKTSFCYWLEHKTGDLGGIAGGSSYKFGVFKKGKSGEIVDGGGRSGDSEYAWYSKYSKDSRQEAFAEVKDNIVAIAKAAKEGNFEVIDAIDLGDAYKWKIAYLYSDFRLINIFRVAALRVVGRQLEIPESKEIKISKLHREIMSKKLPDQDYFMFSHKLWQNYQDRLIDVKKEFSKWLHKNTTDSYRNYLGNTARQIENRLEEIDSFFDSVDLFLVNDENADELINTIQLLLSKKEREKNPEFVAYDLKNSNGIPKAIIGKNNYIRFLRERFEIVESNANRDENEIYDMNKQPLNQLFYGPPGTGKTYHTISEAASIIEGHSIENYTTAKSIFQQNLGERIEFITFHQNYSYEDFIQGLRPDVANQTLSFERTDGIFKKIATKALFEYYRIFKEKELKASLNEPQTIPLAEIYKAFIKTLKTEQSFETISGNSVILDSVSNNNLRFKHFEGGQTYVVSEKRLTKLYQAFDDVSKMTNINNDIRSAIGGSNSTVYYVALREFITFKNTLESNQDLAISNEDRLAELQYEEFDYEQQKEALKDFDFNLLKSIAAIEVPSYVIIIDEINRANISRVFGELITLIEPDKRSHGDVPLMCTLPSGERFIVPSNLHIIGTMNTADKSIALLDIALRRRFEFIPMYPDSGIKGVQRGDLLDKINKQITKLKTRDFTIGHSYFMGNDFKLETTINNKVIPLLLEYFINDEEEVTSILKEAGLEIGGWPLRLLNEVADA